MKSVLVLVLALFLVSCKEYAKPEPVDQPTMREREACAAQAKKEKRSQTYCWSNTKPEGATR